MKKVPWIHYSCPRCGEFSAVVVEDSSPRPVHCSRCSFTFPDSSTACCPATKPLVKCGVCAAEDFYVQKNFNRQLGFTVVGVVSLVAFLVMLIFDPIWGFILLGAVTLIDLVIYSMLRQVSVCYLCQSVYHGFPDHPGHRGFYLGDEERFKALRQSWLEGLHT